jgi:hypothetical protein
VTFLHGTSNVLVFTKMGDLFTKSSGHPTTYVHIMYSFPAYLVLDPRRANHFQILSYVGTGKISNRIFAKYLQKWRFSQKAML